MGPTRYLLAEYQASLARFFRHDHKTTIFLSKWQKLVMAENEQRQRKKQRRRRRNQLERAL